MSHIKTRQTSCSIIDHVGRLILSCYVRVGLGARGPVA